MTPGFPKNEQDSSCLPAFQQFALSVKNQFPQYKLIIISFQYPFQKKNYAWNGIDVIAFGGKNKSKLFRLLIWFKAYKALKKITNQQKVIGIISLWATECALVADKFARKNYLKHLIWIIGQDAKALNKYIKRIKPAATQLIAMSDFLKDEFFKNHFILPSHVVENGINESLFPELNINERAIDIFGAGSLIPLKNYSLFIKLISEIKLIFPNIKAVIAGGGEEERILKTLIRTLNLQDNIDLVGSKSHADTLLLMNDSKVFLHTSNYEGNSTVLMEALYSGCKVVSTCPLSHKITENLYVEQDFDLLKNMVIKILTEKTLHPKKIVFNTMDYSAKRIVDLLQ